MDVACCYRWNSVVSLALQLLVIMLSCSVKAGEVLNLGSHSTDTDTVLIQFSSPRVDSEFRYSINVTCSPGDLTLVRFISETVTHWMCIFISVEN